MTSPYLERPTRSLDEYVAELQAEPARWLQYDEATRAMLKEQARRAAERREKRFDPLTGEGYLADVA